MNAMTTGLRECIFRIPPEILTMAFMLDVPYTNLETTVEDEILNKVIRPRVLPDCNIIKGITITVPLEVCTISYVSDNEAVIKIPRSHTGGRAVLSPLNIVQAVSASFGASPSQSNDAFSQLAGAHNQTGLFQTANLSLIGENAILVTDSNILMGLSGVIRVTVENDANMSNLNPGAFPIFSELIVDAVKAYIYNYKRVSIATSTLYRGHEISKLSSIIEEYADTDEIYRTRLRNEWAKTAFVNDNASMHMLVTAAIGL